MKPIIKLLIFVGCSSIFSCEELINSTPTEKEYSWEKLEGVNQPRFYEGSNLYWENNAKQLFYEILFRGNCYSNLDGAYRFHPENQAWYETFFSYPLPTISSYSPYMSSTRGNDLSFILQISRVEREDYCGVVFEFYSSEYTENEIFIEKLNLPYDFRYPSQITQEGKGLISNLVYNKNGNTILIYDPIAGIREYDVYGNEWSILETENSPPPRTAGTIIVFAESDNSLILFGSENDIWKLDLGNNRWERLENKYQFTDNDGDVNSGENWDFFVSNSNRWDIKIYDKYVYDPKHHRIIIQKSGKLYQYDINGQIWQNLKVTRPFSSSTDIGGFTIDAEKSILYQFNERGLYKMQL